MKRLVILLIAIFLASCSAQVSRTMFLAENVNKITQDEIIKGWGLPQSTSTSGDGATVLIYKYVVKGTPPSVYIPPPSYGSDVGGLPGGAAMRSQPELVRGRPDTCRQYRLTFDRAGVLREYQESDC
ncbi:MAG TPA: hypothetical protein DCZ05_03935 [Deltaproteobacteria bacterium]|nr:hypothetical protein [Deltaproteobacteria bacterium]